MLPYTQQVWLREGSCIHVHTQVHLNTFLLVCSGGVNPFRQDGGGGGGGGYNYSGNPFTQEETDPAGMSDSTPADSFVKAPEPDNAYSKFKQQQFIISPEQESAFAW